MQMTICEFEPLDLGVICGGVRCYKTAHAVRLARLAYLQGYDIYSNLNLTSDKGDWRCERGRLDSLDPKHCLDQLGEILEYIDKEQLYNKPKFLLLDEFSDLVDSQEWKKASWTTGIWKQLGKMGFSTYITNQAFSMTYNRYRENSNKKIITRRIDGRYYLVRIGLQSADDHEEYTKIAQYVADGSWVFDLYNTHQLMYAKK